MKDFSEEIDAKMETVDISFFDEDPDDEPDRAGDGYYFQFAGDADWDGPYESHEEAEEMAEATASSPYELRTQVTEQLNDPVADGLYRFTGLYEGTMTGLDKFAFWHDEHDEYHRFLIDASSLDHARNRLANKGLTIVTVYEIQVTLLDFEAAHGLATNSANDEQAPAFTPA